MVNKITQVANKLEKNYFSILNEETIFQSLNTAIIYISCCNYVYLLMIFEELYFVYCFVRCIDNAVI